MRKLWVLSRKEVLLAFRDVGALLSMLATPLALTLVMAFAFGTGSSSAISDIPVLLLNRDEGVFSEDLVALFTTPEVEDLVIVEQVTDEEAARARVEANEVAALVVIPENFSTRLFPLGSGLEAITGLELEELTPDTELTQAQVLAISQAYLSQEDEESGEPATVEIYANPERRISAAVVKGIVSQGIEMLNMQIQGIMLVIERTQLAGGGTLMGGGTADAGETPWAGFDTSASDTQQELPIKLRITSSTGRGFSWLDYTASSMAIMFLMFSVTSGGRTLLAERAFGTLPRLLVTPTTRLTILLGKMAGIVLTGLLQVVLLWAATTLIGAYWGSPPLVLLAILVLVLCASGVGALIAAWSKTATQASVIGTTLTLVASALSGSFFVRWGLPEWIQQISLITPNAWGIEIFARLQAGLELSAVLPWLGGALLLSVLYYAAALLGFRRQLS